MLLLKKNFHTNLADTLLKDIQYGRGNFYYFLGKVVPWVNSDAPDSTSESELAEIDARREIIRMKKVSVNEVSLTIARHDWTYSEIYDMYNSTIDMTSKKFYVMTDEYNVYKCLYSTGVGSTAKPTGTSVNPFYTGDGYQWKYLYTVPFQKRNLFMSPLRIPVQRALSDSFYSRGAVYSVSVIAQGSGYTDAPLTQINVSGGTPVIPATMVPVISRTTGEVLDVVITEKGSGYVSPPTLTLTNPGSTGSGLWGPTAVLTPVVQGGKVERVLIADPGQNYSVDTDTEIAVSGDGTGAKFTPVIDSGKVIDVAIDDPGTGYTYMTLSVVGNGSGAIITPTLTTSDLLTDQANIELTAVPGAIYQVVVTNPGNNYTSASATVVGDGTGCTLSVTIASGAITKITVLTPGSGYTNAQVVITGNNIDNNPLAVSAEAYAILPPKGGHGSDVVSELYGDTFCLYSSIRQSLTSEPDQDFRQYGLIKMPRDLYTDELITRQNASTLFTVTLSSYADLVKYGILYAGTNKYRIIDWVGTSVSLLPLDDQTINIGDILIAQYNTALTYTVAQITSTPEVNKYTGNLLFYCNESKFSFTDEQNITLRTFLQI